MIPPALRARAEASPADTIGSFHHQLNVLRRTGGYVPRPGYGEFGLVPVPRAQPADLTRKRRRDVLVTLLWIMGGTLALGVMPAFRGLLVLHVAADAVFAGYVLLLRQMRKVAEARQRELAVKVTRLRRLPDGVTDLALRRAALR